MKRAGDDAGHGRRGRGPTSAGVGGVRGALALVTAAALSATTQAAAAPPTTTTTTTTTTREVSSSSATAEARLARAPLAGPSRVILLARREGDPLSSSTDALLRERIRAGVRAAGVGVIEAASLPAGTEVCDQPRCLAGLRSSLGIGHVVRATLASIDRDYALRLELVDTADASVVATYDEHCELCGLAEAGDRLEAGARGLFGQAAARPAAAPATAEDGRLRLTSSPPGASVTIDGVLAGEAPIDRALAPGRHTVVASAPGHRTLTQELMITGAEASTIHLALVPEPPPRWGGVLLVLGIPMIAGGIATLALDDRPRPRGCEPASGACGEFETTWAGAGLLAGGAVLTTLGAVMVRRARAHRRASRR